MTTQEKLAALAQRAIPFLRDEGARWADDGSNEPLELARDIEEALSEHGGGGEAFGWYCARDKRFYRAGEWGNAGCEHCTSLYTTPPTPTDGGEVDHTGYLVDGKDFYYADFPRSEWSKHNSVVPLYLHPPTTGAPVVGEAPAYGIIDPDYARVFTIARCLAWAEGYALAMQGSFTRDLDLLAVPWTDAACEPEHLARRIEEAAGLRITHPSKDGEKPHGRLVWTMKFKAFGDPRFVDLSIMPRLTPPAAAPRVE